MFARTVYSRTGLGVFTGSESGDHRTTADQTNELRFITIGQEQAKAATSALREYGLVTTCNLGKGMLPSVHGSTSA